MVLEDHVKAGLVEIFYFSDSWQYDKDFYRSSARSFLSPQGWAYDNCFKWVPLPANPLPLHHTCIGLGSCGARLGCMWRGRWGRGEAAIAVGGCPTWGLQGAAEPGRAWRHAAGLGFGLLEGSVVNEDGEPRWRSHGRPLLQPLQPVAWTVVVAAAWNDVLCACSCAPLDRSTPIQGNTPPQSPNAHTRPGTDPAPTLYIHTRPTHA